MGVDGARVQEVVRICLELTLVWSCHAVWWEMWGSVAVYRGVKFTNDHLGKTVCEAIF